MGRVGIPPHRLPELYCLILTLQRRVPRSPIPPCGTSLLNCPRVKVPWRALATTRNLLSLALHSLRLLQHQRIALLLQGWTRTEVGPGRSRERGGRSMRGKESLKGQAWAGFRRGRGNIVLCPYRIAWTRRHCSHRDRRPAGYLRGVGSCGRRAKEVFCFLKSIKEPRRPGPRRLCTLCSPLFPPYPCMCEPVCRCSHVRT